MPTPFTKTRLASSLSLVGVHQVTDTGVPIPSWQDFLNAPTLGAGIAGQITSAAATTAARLADFTASIQVIGAASMFRVSQSGTNQARRGIDSAREPFAVVPGPISTSIELERAVLYLEDAMAAFKFMPNNIAHQTRPIIIIENVSLPGETDPQDATAFLKSSLKNIIGGVTGKDASPVFYLYCWVRESRITYDLKGGDQAVMQSVVLDVGRVMVPASLTSAAIGEVAGAFGGLAGQAAQLPIRILASNVPLISRIT